MLPIFWQKRLWKASIMKVKSEQFISVAEIAIHDKEMQAAVNTGTRTAFERRIGAMYEQGNEHGEALRQQAAEAKRRALRKLPALLEQAEAKMIENGMQVLWAEDAAEASKHVLNIARKHHVQSVIKSTSMVTEEIALNNTLIEAGIKVVETDLGEYIIQLNDEPPSHIIAPVIHKTKAQIRQIFQDKLDMPYTDDAQTMVAFAREKLRQEFMTADMGISGGNFIIAETGSICLVTNEGNGRMVTSMPRVHVALIGIEKVIENLDDYATLTQVLPRSGTGQKMTVYTNILNGACGDGGPETVYVILVDNGRSEIYAQPKYTESLACIRCGACQNACPVYRVTGGHAYGWVYGGPIGAVVTPLLVGLDRASPLPNASSLCGACKQVCPVDIDLPRMLLDLRHDLVETRQTELKWDAAIKAWEIGNSSARVFELAGKAAGIALEHGLDNALPNPLGEWKKYRDFPDFAPKSFRQLWREKKGKA
jgi:L-lactate dehydrogenase complex protein LldF